MDGNTSISSFLSGKQQFALSGLVHITGELIHSDKERNKCLITPCFYRMKIGNEHNLCLYYHSCTANYLECLDFTEKHSKTTLQSLNEPFSKSIALPNLSFKVEMIPGH